MRPFRNSRACQGVILLFAAFSALAVVILAQLTWKLSDFDQLFYTTIAYDLDRYGVFSNGIFDQVDSTLLAPPPGMFFGPVYPLLVLAGMKIDHRFAEAVTCSVATIHNHGDESACEA